MVVVCEGGGHAHNTIPSRAECLNGQAGDRWKGGGEGEALGGTSCLLGADAW